MPIRGCGKFPLEADLTGKFEGKRLSRRFFPLRLLEKGANYPQKGVNSAKNDPIFRVCVYH
jgi:hypothetical protein